MPSLRRSLRALFTAVAVALAAPIVLAAGAALPWRALIAGIVLGVFVGAVARTGMWLVAAPPVDRANALAVASGLTAGAAALLLGLLALLAGPVVLVAVPLFTGLGVLTWWVLRGEPRRSVA